MEESSTYNSQMITSGRDGGRESTSILWGESQYTGCPKKCTLFVLFIVSIFSNTASSDLYQKITSFMEIYWHYLWTLSRVHDSHYGTCSSVYFLATPHCSASGLLGQTLGWVNRANDRKDRLIQSSQGFWCPLVHNTLQVPTPQEKSGAVKSGEHCRQLTEAQSEKKTPLETVLQPGQVIAECSCVSRWSIFLKRLLVECARAFRI